MTKIITRYFGTREQALKAWHELVQRQQVSPKIMRLYDKADGLAETLTAAKVAPDTAKAYQDHVAKGGAVLLVAAGFKPLGVAKTTRTVTAQMGATQLEGLVEEVEVEDRLRAHLSILPDHDLMLSKHKDPYSTNFHMANWPIPLISRRKPSTVSVLPPHARMAAFPVPLIIRLQPFTESIFPKHARMANWPIPLLSRRKPFTGSIIGRHARMANFPIPLLSRRKPFAGTAIGRHTRMANWPFPLLINGKQGENALVPGGARMANFPIPLLSDRKPSNKSIFPKHARMANFPIGLISRRKPFTGSIIGRHARMADFILPLVIRRSEGDTAYGSKVFSFSRMLGWPTLIKR